jgi:hypothetical protein
LRAPSIGDIIFLEAIQMISVYRVIPDLDKYQYVLEDDPQAMMKYQFDGSEIGVQWQPPRCYKANPRKPRPDFWGCFMNNSVFAITSEIERKADMFVDQSCETLPFETDDGDKFYLCNVTCVVPALDTKRTRHEEGLPHAIDEYVFLSNRFDYSLFKIPETAMSEVLCVQGRAAPEEEFKGTVEKYGLKGFEFKKLWSSP